MNEDFTSIGEMGHDELRERPGLDLMFPDEIKEDLEFLDVLSNVEDLGWVLGIEPIYPGSIRSFRVICIGERPSDEKIGKDFRMIGLPMPIDDVMLGVAEYKMEWSDRKYSVWVEKLLKYNI